MDCLFHYLEHNMSQLRRQNWQKQLKGNCQWRVNGWFANLVQEHLYSLVQSVSLGNLLYGRTAFLHGLNELSDLMDRSKLHFCWRTRSWSLTFGWFRRKLLPRISQACSIGDLIEQPRTRMLLSSSIFGVRRAVRGCALSCWKLSHGYALKKSRTTDVITWSQYRCAIY